MKEDIAWALVSIVMPAYNAVEYIGEAIESIIAQDYTNWELLIADDGSKDATSAKIAAYAAKDARIKALPNPKNMGYQATCNRLFELCGGEYITFLDADDFSPPVRLTLQVAAFAANPNLGMVGTAYDIVDMSSKLIDTVSKPLTYVEIQASMPTNSCFCGATIMIRRAVYNEIGGYREFFKDYAYQDYDWSYCIADKFEAINLPEALYSYRQSPQSNSKKILAKRFVSDKIVQHLGRQRAATGQDDLERGALADLQIFIDGLLAPFAADPALIYRKYAENFMYNRLYSAAIGAAWQAIKQKPTAFINYRTWLYCVRVSAWRRLVG